MLLLIDNYDSFTYNLVQLIGSLGVEPIVVRNDLVTVEELAAMRPSGLIVSPGPGGPEASGVSMPAIRWFLGRIPILGVCLGHQCLAAVLGARVVRSPRPVHGKSSPVLHDGSGIFADVPRPMSAARYHSLVVDPESVPARLRVVAKTEDGQIMGVSDSASRSFGVQFHPESFLTKGGSQLAINFLRMLS